MWARLCPGKLPRQEQQGPQVKGHNCPPQLPTTTARHNCPPQPPATTARYGHVQDAGAAARPVPLEAEPPHSHVSMQPPGTFQLGAPLMLLRLLRPGGAGG